MTTIYERKVFFMKNSLKLLVTLIMLASTHALANVEVMKTLTEPILFTNSIQQVTVECRQSMRKQILQFLDKNHALHYGRMSIKDIQVGKKYTNLCDMKNPQFDNCLGLNDVNIFAVKKSLVYRGSEFVAVADGLSPFVFPQDLDTPWEELRADVNKKCQLTNFRLSKQYSY